MATKTILVDDIDGSDGDVAPHRFSLDDETFEIDLSSEHLAQLQQALAPYRDAARAKRVRSRGRKRSRGDEDASREVRVWARENGYEVNSRGRVSAEVMDAWREANPGKA